MPSLPAPLQDAWSVAVTSLTCPMRSVEGSVLGVLTRCETSTGMLTKLAIPNPLRSSLK